MHLTEIDFQPQPPPGFLQADSSDVESHPARKGRQPRQSVATTAMVPVPEMINTPTAISPIIFNPERSSGVVDPDRPPSSPPGRLACRAATDVNQHLDPSRCVREDEIRVIAAQTDHELTDGFPGLDVAEETVFEHIESGISPYRDGVPEDQYISRRTVCRYFYFYQNSRII